MALRQDELQALERALRARARYLRGEVTDKLGEAASDAGGMNTGGDFGDQSFASSESTSSCRSMPPRAAQISRWRAASSSTAPRMASRARSRRTT